MIAAIIVVAALLGGLPGLAAALLVPAAYFADTALLWVLYLAIMNLDRVNNVGRLPARAVPLAKAVLYIGLAIDLAYNWTWAAIVFLDAPRELLVTDRLRRYKYGRAYRIFRDGWRLRVVRVTAPLATGWRLDRANWYCDVMLDPYDPHPSGKHVRP